jgi:threonine aldolase
MWNAASRAASVERLAAPFDMVAVSFSKGLGAPGGSLLAGSRELIARAVRHRRMLGGAMRQVGIFAAAALHGLEHHLAGLRDDHANARLLAERLAESPRIVLDLGTVQTNIVVFSLAPGAPDAAALVAAARGRGVWVNALGARTIRALTHRDVSRAQCLEAAGILAQCAEGGQGPSPA